MLSAELNANGPFVPCQTVGAQRARRSLRLIVQNLLYFHSPVLRMKMTVSWGETLFDAHFVRLLCRELADEEDPGKAEELISLLRAVVKDDQEEIKTRMKFLARKYARFFSESDSKAA